MYGRPLIYKKDRRTHVVDDRHAPRADVEGRDAHAQRGAGLGQVAALSFFKVVGEESVYRIYVCACVFWEWLGRGSVYI